MIRPSEPLLRTPEGLPLVAHECQKFGETMQHHPQLAILCKDLLIRHPLNAKALVLFEDELDARGALFSFPDSNTVARARAFRLGCMMHWGLTQPWASECNVAKCLKEWSIRLSGASRSPNISCAIMGLGVTSLLKEPALNLDAAQKMQLHYHLYNTMSRLVPWDTLSEQGSGQDFVVAPLGLLAAKCPKEKVKGTLIWTHWAQNLRRSLDSMSPADQTRLARQLLGTPDLPPSAKRAALKSMTPLVWLDPVVKEKLLPLLPLDEDKRRKMLPWAPNFWKHDSPTKRLRPGPVNRSLHELYCPLLCIGLQLLDLSLVDWEDRSYIEFCVKEVAPNEQGHLDLPDGLDLEP